jgi:serine phosphatase RsbU (regulator of sigma subunit)
LKVDSYIYHKDRESPELLLKGRFFVYSVTMFFVLCFSAFPYFAISDPGEFGRHPEYFWSNVIMLAMIVAFLLYYRARGHRVLLVDIITFFGWLSTFGTYETTGGIYSPDNIWGIIISGWVFLVGNKRSGVFWFILSALTLTFFYLAEKAGMKDFASVAHGLSAGYFYFNYLLACIFLLLIIFLYERSMNRFVHQLKDAKGEIESKNRDILDSINYARRIQFAVLPHEETIARGVPLSFIFYVPKDIVSGDFYWFHEISAEEYILVCADCTGHGVPGAFMTVVGSNLLNQTVIDNRIYSPAAVLGEMERLLNVTLRQDSQRLQGVQDGMDLSLIRVNRSTQTVTVASARRPVIFISGDEMREIKADKFSLGGMVGGAKVFTEQSVSFRKDDLLFMYTDGFPDQFGGPKGKKYSSRRLRDFFYAMRNETAAAQHNKLAAEFTSWSGQHGQVDDVCVMGVRF